ncbi:MAG: tetratricopeptide (TPR) repeat protein [Parasphingorhabdus sp.]|jgi:tetratricopeptide (TPR) repeat protein
MSLNGTKKLLQQILILLKQGKLIEAEKLLIRACKQEPKNSQIWFLRGTIHFEQGNTNDALKHLQTAIAIDPENVEAHFVLCKLYLSQGNLVRAIDHVENVVELDSQHGTGWLALGSLYSDAGLFQKAEQASRTALALLPNIVEAKINLANALISQAKIDEAMALCKNIKQTNPKHSGLWHSLGIAFKALGLIQDAEYCFNIVITRETHNADAFCTLGEIKVAQDELSQALLLYNKSRNLAPDNPRVHFELGKILLPNSSEKHRQLVQQLEQDHLYRDISEAKNIARTLAIDFQYGDVKVEQAVVRFFDEYDPSCLHLAEWWTNALQQFGDPRRAHDTAMRSIYSTVFSWSIPCKEALDEIVAFTDKRLASYGSGAGYWEHLLAMHYDVEVVCHDKVLRHRFIEMTEMPHSEAKVNPLDSIFLAWLPGEMDANKSIELLLNQTVVGQKLVLVGEPADEHGYPRTCGTQGFFCYVKENFEVRATIPLANYAYFKDRVELLVRK